MRNFPAIFFKLNFWIMALIAVQVTAIIFLCLYLPAFLPITLSLALVWLLSAVSAVVLILRRGSPEAKCAWFLIITAIPVAGAIIFYVASVRPKPHGILNVTGITDGEYSKAAAASCGTVAAEYLNAEYFSSGSDFWTSALERISAAKKSVYLEFFIISRGHLFNCFSAALENAIKNGAEVKIIADGVGSAFRIGRKDLKRLKAMGAEIKVFHRLPPFPRANINLRDHRKIITIDGRIAYTGGVNLADEYINLESPYGFWKDNGVSVSGEAAKIFEGMFLAMWRGRYEMPAPKMGENNCLPFYDSPGYRTYCEDAYVTAISSAKERVHILTPYFCLSDKTYSALSFAAKRGIDVKIIIPHVPDKKYAFAVTKAFAQNLKPYGVKIYEYTPGFMHAKCVICDNSVFLGSYNFDFRSTHFNYECGAAFSGAVCDEAENDFQQCLALSTQMQEGRLSRAKKFSRFVLRLLSPLI